MKRIIALGLFICIVLSFASCVAVDIDEKPIGGDNKSKDRVDDVSDAVTDDGNIADIADGGEDVTDDGNIADVTDGGEDVYDNTEDGEVKLLPDKVDGSDIKPILPSLKKVEFKYKYLRTNGYHEGMAYPQTVIIKSKEELDRYCNLKKSLYNFGNEEYGFIKEMAEYGDEYFESSSLVFVLMEFGSGSVRQEVLKTSLESGVLSTEIGIITPEVGTCDMAQWHIVIEVHGSKDVESVDLTTPSIRELKPIID